MRIIGGKFRGRRIIAPKGDIARPTADRVREALFSKLQARDDVVFEGARVIDLFAGSGALGFEALSRGAAFCLFVESDAAARGAIRDNIDALDLFGETRVHRRSATSLGARPANFGVAFSIAFLDPPYGAGLGGFALSELAAGGWLAQGALAIIEQGAKETPACAHGFVEIDRKTYGAAQIGLYRYDPGAGD